MKTAAEQINDSAPQANSKVTTVNMERFKQCVFFRLTVTRWGNRAKVKDATALSEYLAQKKAEITDGTGANPAQADASLTGSGVSTTKRLLKSPALDRMNEHLTKTKNTLLSFCNPSNIQPGLFVTSVEQVARFEEILEQALTDLAIEYVPAFEADFAPAIERARTDKIKDGGLGPLFVANEYPSAERAAGCFGLSWNWLSLDIPENLPAELRAQQKEKLERQFADAAEQVQLALREGLRELVKHATEALTPGEDGKKRIFRNTLTENIQDFINTFGARNIMGDAELAALVQKAQEVLTGIQGKPGQKQADALRTNDAMREATRQQFADLTKQLDTLVETQQSRSFDFAND